MRVQTLALVATGLLIASPSASAASLAFEDNKLNFTSCDGLAITARWRGHKFSLAEPGKSLGDDHVAMKAKTWDGTCSSIRWDQDKATFVIGDGKAESPASLIRYIAPDGAKWIGIRAGDGFFVTKIVSAGEEPTTDRMSEVAAWLSRTSRDFTPGAELAERLKQATADVGKTTAEPGKQ